MNIGLTEQEEEIVDQLAMYAAFRIINRFPEDLNTEDIRDSISMEVSIIADTLGIRKDKEEELFDTMQSHIKDRREEFENTVDEKGKEGVVKVIQRIMQKYLEMVLQCVKKQRKQRMEEAEDLYYT